jgi:hypothetical protein
MADWWQPTAETYLGRVKKDQIIEALTEATDAHSVADLAKLKKGVLRLVQPPHSEVKGRDHSGAASWP